MSDNLPGKSGEPKMVRESDLLAVKRQAEKLKEELAKINQELAQSRSELKLTKANLDDDEAVAKVRQMLLKQAEDLETKEQEFQKREATLSEREKDGRVQVLAAKYGLKAEDLKDADDPEKRALELQVEHLTKEKEDKRGEPTPAEEVFERGAASTPVKKNVWDMKPEEFADYEKKLKTEALSKK